MTSAKRTKSLKDADKLETKKRGSSSGKNAAVPERKTGNSTPPKVTSSKKKSPKIETTRAGSVRSNKNREKKKAVSKSSKKPSKKVSASVKSLQGKTSKSNKSINKKTLKKKTVVKKSIKKAAIKDTIAKKSVITKPKKKPAPAKETHKKDRKIPHSTAVSSFENNVHKKKSHKKSPRSAPEFPTTTWGTDSIVSFEATDVLPPPELTSIAGGFVFHGDSVVLANIPGRGWEIIGGRIDLGETPEETFRRETMRQIGVSLSHIQMIGIIRIEHLGPEPPNCPYPFPIGYGVQYIGIVDALLPFNGSEESLGRSLISSEGFKEHYYDWNEYFEAVFNYAFAVYKKLLKKLKP